MNRRTEPNAVFMRGFAAGRNILAKKLKTFQAKIAKMQWSAWSRVDIAPVCSAGARDHTGHRFIDQGLAAAPFGKLKVAFRPGRQQPI